jgi:hypothetical protein
MSSTPSSSLLDQPNVVFGAAGREADAAVASRHRGHPMRRRGRQLFRPDQLAVVVGVHVDEARRHHQAARIDLLAPRSGEGAHGGDLAARQRHVGLERLAPGAVEHRPAPDHQVNRRIHHVPPSFRPPPDLARSMAPSGSEECRALDKVGRRAMIFV